MAKRSLVSVVDDDESVRESLPCLLNELGYDVRAFASAEEFLGADALDGSSCLVLDIAMPGMSGPELQQALKVRRPDLPIVFITARPSDAATARVIEQGAVACLLKPFTEAALIEALDAAFAR